MKNFVYIMSTVLKSKTCFFRMSNDEYVPVDTTDTVDTHESKDGGAWHAHRTKVDRKLIVFVALFDERRRWKEEVSIVTDKNSPVHGSVRT